MLMSEHGGVIWLDGKFVPWQEAKVHILTHTLHYGTGVFEGIRAYKAQNRTNIFRLNEHIERLFRSAIILGIEIPYDKSALKKACCDVVENNNLEEAYIRPICFLGSENLGISTRNLTVRVAIAAWHLGSYLGEESADEGVCVRTSSYIRNHVNASFSKAKAISNYANSTLALNEAQQCGAREALMLDADGFVAEGSGENVFLVHNNTLYTPETTSALDGITRQTIITLAQEIGIPVLEKRITRDEFYIADEAFFTGTAAEVTPIKMLDGRMIGTKQKRITRKLQDMYCMHIHGQSPAHPEWLTPVIPFTPW